MSSSRVTIWTAFVSILTLSRGVYSIDVGEIIHGLYLKGFLPFFSIGKSQYYINMYICLESYFKAHVLRGWPHNLDGLIIRRLLCKYRGDGGSLFITENEIHLCGFI